MIDDFHNLSFILCMYFLISVLQLCLFYNFHGIQLFCATYKFHFKYSRFSTSITLPNDPRPNTLRNSKSSIEILLNFIGITCSFSPFKLNLSTKPIGLIYCLGSSSSSSGSVRFLNRGTLSVELRSLFAYIMVLRQIPILSIQKEIISISLYSLVKCVWLSVYLLTMDD